MAGGSIDLDFYGGVDARAREIAEQIRSMQLVPQSEQLAYVVREATRLAQSPGLGLRRGSIEGSAVGEIFDLLDRKLGEVMTGREEFCLQMRDRPALWESFMVEGPLGWYAELAAETLSRLPEIRGKVLELGAGVGNTSRLVASFADPAHYVRTDLNIKLLKAARLPSQIAYFDFNQRGKWEGMDLIFAVNALHCAANKGAVLENIRDMLKPGGVILLGEGAPESLPGVPWCLNYLCGFFDGWWNEGGFLEPGKWIALLREAGLTDIQLEALDSGNLEMGGVVWARRA